MMQQGRFRRVRVSWGADVEVSADAFIDAAANWLGLIDFLHPDHPFRFVDCTAAPGADPTKLPLERRLWPDTSAMTPEEAAATPDFFSETLYRVDREAGTLLYSVGDGPLGMRNYWAWKEVDALGPDRCHASINTRFDIPADMPVDEIKAMLEKVYEGVIRGIELKLRQQ